MRRFLVLTFLFALAPQLHAQQPASRNEVADKILAVVGDSIILKSDVDLEFLQMKNSGVQVTDSAAIYRKILDRRIGELVMLQAAVKDTTLKITQDQINQATQSELDARRRQFGTEQQFQQALQQAGMTMDELRNQIQQDVSGKLLLRNFISKMQRDRKAPPVTENDIKKYFEDNKAQFGQRPATVSFNQVVLAPRASDSARATARKKAEDILLKLRQGGDFETLAKQNSEDPGSRERGGDLGWFRQGDMVKEFSDVAFAMQPGQISGIVESPFGFHIIKLDKVRGAERNARHILIIPTIAPADVERLRVYADTIAQKVRAGASMDSLNRAIGDSNEQFHVGPYPADSLKAPYNPAVNSALAGQVVGPLELPTANGASKFSIVKVTATQPAGEYTLTDPQLHEYIRSTLEQNSLVDEVIADLKRKTLVDIRMDK